MDSDVLDRALQEFGMHGVFYAVSNVPAPWGVTLPPMPGTMIFHLLTYGEAVIEVEGTWVAVRPGDLLLVAHGTGHVILDAPGSIPVPLFDLPRVEQTDRYERIWLPGEGTRTELICGAVSFTGLGVERLVRSLPPVLLVGRDEDSGWQRAALDVIAAESHRPRPGSDVVTARLADVLVVQAVRSWLESTAPDRGWVAGLRDPALGRALAAFHADPAHPWTLESLARTAGLSRSAFAARFTAVMGETAMGYVTSWRMDLAARLVREQSLPLARVADRVGYRSEAAFNRAFRRAHGVTPGAYSRRGAGVLDRLELPAPA